MKVTEERLKIVEAAIEECAKTWARSPTTAVNPSALLESLPEPAEHEQAAQDALTRLAIDVARAEGARKERERQDVDAECYRLLREQAEAALNWHRGPQRTGKTPMLNPAVATEIIRTREYIEHARAAQDAHGGKGE